MALDLKTQYGSAGQVITIGLNDLADDGVVISSAVDNSLNLFNEVLAQIIVNAGAGASGVMSAFAIGSIDGGVTFPDTVNDELHPIGIWNVTSEAVFNSPLFSVSLAFGFKLPQFWKLVVRNETGAALKSSGNSAKYQGILGQYTT